MQAGVFDLVVAIQIMALCAMCASLIVSWTRDKNLLNIEKVEWRTLQ